ncbi:DMP19 family protein [Paenibacillus amylolyticus]|uniref:DMP19 family protein n=1 Tax=Paenibacillus amylolyticus TaxID=1451 RepID=UPI003EC11A46
MNKLQEELAELLPLEHIEGMSGEEIVGSIAMDMYRAEFATIMEHVAELPVVLRDIMLIIDLDTELSMNGLTGYLENASGQHLREAIEALKRNGNETDAMILQKVEQLLAEQSITTGELRENVERLSVHDITTSRQTHGPQIHELLQQVEQEGQHLSFQADNEESFDLLYQYVDDHKDELKQQLEQFLVL